MFIAVQRYTKSPISPYSITLIYMFLGLGAGVFSGSSRAKLDAHAD